MQRVLVLGGGMIGRVIARTLAEDFEVTVLDASKKVCVSLKDVPHVTPLVGDFRNKSIGSFVKKFDCIVGAMPGKIAYSVLKKIIPAGKPIVDISFFEEDPYCLQDLARKYHTPVVVDFGVAPGLSNMMLGREVARMPIDSFICYCGGLPENPKAPWFYKAPFEVASAMDICVRPARMKIDDMLVEKPAMSDFEIVDFDGIGGLEAFSTDGLRTLLNFPVSTMVEKTLRHIGFRRIMRPFVEGGFFSEKPQCINGTFITPFEMSERVLQNAWALSPEEEEFTALRLCMNGPKARMVYDLIDRGDRVHGTSSMARLAGYPCAAVVHLFAKNLLSQTGIITPEEIGMQNTLADFVLNFLENHGIRFSCRLFV